MAHRVSPAAEAELDEIWTYLATQSGSFDVADRCVDNLARTFFLLATQPRMGRRRDDELRPGLRSFASGQYVVIYRLDGEDVVILHVVRGSRNVTALLGD